MTDTIEANYQKLKALFQQRREIHRVQEFMVLWQMILLKLEVPESNIQALDVRDGGKLVGFWLKKRDYTGKLRRKEQARLHGETSPKRTGETGAAKDSRGRTRND